MQEDSSRSAHKSSQQRIAKKNKYDFWIEHVKVLSFIEQNLM